MSTQFPESASMMDLQDEKVFSVLRRVQNGTTGMNEPIYEWQEVAQVRGQIMPRSGGLRMHDPGMYSIVMHQFFTRWRLDSDGKLIVRPKDILAGPGKRPMSIAYSVEFVADEGGARTLLSCDLKEGVLQNLQLGVQVPVTQQ